MAEATVKITLSDGTIHSLSERVGSEEAPTDFELLDKALNQLQKKTNDILTAAVEEEKKQQNSSGNKNTNSEANGDDDDDDDDEDEDDDDDVNDVPDGKPPEKKQKT